MNKLLTWCTVALVLCAAGAVAGADTDINVSGQVRIRHETVKKDFDPDAATMDFTDMRTRVKVEAVVEGNTHAVVQFQDSRRFGANTVFDDPASGELSDGKNTDIHQAFVQIDRLWADSWGAKIGRFEFNLGNQRVFGAVGWHNVGRVWEGLQSWYDTPDLNVTGFALKKIELSDPDGNRDYDIFGVHGRAKKAGLDVFAFHEYDANNKFLPAEMNKLDRTNAGAFLKKQHEQVDVEANAVVQFGQQVEGLGEEAVERDIMAFLLTLEAGYTIPGSGKARVAAGVDYSSGDDDASDDEINTYTNAYYTGHKFRGYMDYFVPTDAAGLIDLYARGKASPSPGWVVAGDLHYFMTAADYTDFQNNKTTDVGIELNLAVNTTQIAGVGLVIGGAAFFPTKSYAEMEDADPGLWLFSMLTADF